MGEKSGPDFDGDLGLLRKEKTKVRGASENWSTETEKSNLSVGMESDEGRNAN